MGKRELFWKLLWAQQLLAAPICSDKTLRKLTAAELDTALRHPCSALWRRISAALATQAAPRIPDDVVLRCDEDFPERLRQLHDPPFGIFVWGNRELLRHSPSVAVVGARRARDDSREAARSISAQLARRGVCIVSGLALGIDGVAHTAALDAEGPTVAVLGSGFGCLYPKTHEQLARDVVEGGGLLVSEYWQQWTARPWCFAARNRIIAGLSDFVVVVQARLTSGSMLTVKHAMDLGVDIGAVPSGVSDIEYQGSISLLRDGAPAIVDSHSVYRAMGLQPDDDPHFGNLLELLRDPRTVYEVAGMLDIPIGDAVEQLVDLELEGLVTRCHDGSYLNPAAIAAPT